MTATALSAARVGDEVMVTRAAGVAGERRLVYVLPSYDAGSGEHYAHVVPFLEALGARADVAVVIERCVGTPAIANVQRIDVLPRGIRPLFRMAALALRLARLRGAGYRKVFVRISMPAGLVAGTIGRLLGMESYYWNSGQGKNIAPPWGPGLRAFLTRVRYEAKLVPFYLTTRLVHHFVTGPESMAAYYASQYGVPRKKITILYNDLDVPRFEARLRAHDRAEARRHFGLDTEAPIILFVGRVSPLKGGPHLIPIAERVLARRPDARFLVVGHVYLDEFTRALGHVPFAGRVHAVGALPNADIARAYRAADVFVLPSNSEGFPRVLLECMAAGLPFVAFDVGGVREIAAPEHGGMVVPRGDVGAFAERIVELLDDAPRAADLGAVGRARARRYDTQRVAEMFVERVLDLVK